MHWIKRESIQTRYVLSGLAICLVSLVLISLTSFIVSYKITSTQSTAKMQQMVGKNAAELDSWFRGQSGIVENIVEDIQIVGNYDPDFLSRLLKHKRNLYREGVSDYYIGFAGSNQKMVSAIGWIPSPEYNCQTRAWYRRALKSREPVFTVPYVDAQSGKMVITISKSIWRNGKIFGVFAADIFVSKMIGIVRNYRVPGHSYAFLLDGDGDFLVHPHKEFQPDIKGMTNIKKISGVDYSGLIREASAGEARVVKTRDFDGRSKYFIFSKIKSSGWTFGIAILGSEYLKPLQWLFYGFIIAFLASAVVGVFIMFKLIGEMIRPIKSLNDTVRSFSTSHMEIRSNIDSRDELGELGRNFNNMADTIQGYSNSLERKVAQRTQELQEKNDRIMESIDYAERLQRAILPPLSLRLGSDAEKSFAVWKPRDRVGGDFYWCKGDEDCALLAVADCTGHGVPGALMTMALSSIMDGLPRVTVKTNPGEILETVHFRLRETLGQDRDDSLANDGADMALCLLDKKNRRILFSGARLSLFVGCHGHIVEYKGIKHSIGYTWNKAIHFECQEIAWTSGSVLYITTDGLLDQNTQEGGGALGKTAFISFLKSVCDQPLPQQKEAVESLIAARLSRVGQRDDILVIGVAI